ncbi:MAG: hypothetical protein HYV95_05250 [Opitutae bacterium]|nr:hypothetical protein [Opitutae bacterium]
MPVHPHAVARWLLLPAGLLLLSRGDTPDRDASPAAFGRSKGSVHGAKLRHATTSQAHFGQTRTPKHPLDQCDTAT